ncbi:cellulose binding domain-containing protein [Streptomyces sp. TRM76323]|uniref:Cellulose binding domain-containing protein n=1 Tax=Streptomyces tamarix TaxID=3078565 RepID=A0ABU3QP20_9ACTN|nr:cellulose binding domain-containing protein [Streptomyces tamarix]MDT9684501.1 cellulose binding domain-containing protein [Streptomyces tamarix]
MRSPTVRRLWTRTTAVLACLVIPLAALVGLAAPAQAAEAKATYQKTQDWGSGFAGQWTVKNTGTTAISGWTVSWDFPAGTSVASAWDATVTNSGTRWTAKNASYNGTLAPGASVSFGFNGIGTGGGNVTNCVLNGASCDGSDVPGDNPPSAPGTPSAGTVTDTSVALSWTAATDDKGVKNYDVYRGTTKVATVTTTGYTDTGLSPGTTYGYSVRARDTADQVGPASGTRTVTTTGGGGGGPRFIQAAPYLYLGWGNPPSATEVMKATGTKWFTMAFILAQNGCNPAWDSQRPLLGGVDESTIKAIRAAGGDIVPSIGGWSGNKLGPNCSTPEALAGAYQKVIDAYGLKAIDIDIENTDEFENAAVQDRILTALKIVKQNNPGLRTILTFPTLISGPNSWGNRLIERAHALDADIDNFTIMPFNFGGGADMYGSTVKATEGLKNKLKSVFGWTDAEAYAHIGISGMNGSSDTGEITTPQIWTQIRDWANSHDIGRLAFWSVNRDRPNWEFTSITAGFTG